MQGGKRERKDLPGLLYRDAVKWAAWHPHLWGHTQAFRDWDGISQISASWGKELIWNSGRGGVTLTWHLLVTTEASRIGAGLCFWVLWEQSCTRGSPLVEIWPIVVHALTASSCQGKERLSVFKIVPHLSFHSDFKTAWGNSHVECSKPDFSVVWLSPWSRWEIPFIFQVITPCCFENTWRW